MIANDLRPKACVLSKDSVRGVHWLVQHRAKAMNWNIGMREGKDPSFEMTRHDKGVRWISVFFVFFTATIQEVGWLQ